MLDWLQLIVINFINSNNFSQKFEYLILYYCVKFFNSPRSFTMFLSYTALLQRLKIFIRSYIHFFYSDISNFQYIIVCYYFKKSSIVPKFHYVFQGESINLSTKNSHFIEIRFYRDTTKVLIIIYSFYEMLRSAKKYEYVI